MKQAALVLLLFLTAACASSNEPSLAITNVTVIDGTGAAPRPATNVIVRGGKIAAIGARVPRNAQVVYGRGKYLIPGLFDMHTHLSFWGADALDTLVRYGVLGVRDLGGSLEELDRWRAEIDGGTRIGPRIFRAGPYIDGVRKYDETTDAGKLRKATTIMVGDAAEARAAVISLKQRGVDTIKTHRSLTREAFLAVADECRRQDLPLATHLASPTVTLEEASDAHVTTLEHCEMLTESIVFAAERAGGPKKDPVQALDEITDERAMELFHRFARNGTAYDPNLVAYRTFMQEAVDMLPKDPRWKSAAEGRTKMFNRFVQLAGLMHKAGVVVVTGTDFGVRPETVPYPVSRPGIDVHEEIRLLVDGGFTPMEALQAATIAPARILRAAVRLGTIEAGKEANLVLLDADPLADITNTRKISAVILRGRLVDAQK